MEPPAPIWLSSEEHAARLANRRRQRSRRRLFGLGAFLLLGLALGNIYATGFATSGGATGATGEASPNYLDPGNKQDTSGLNGLITSSGDLSWSWQGQWGSVASQAMYTVDLDTEPAEDDFFVGVYLTNVPTGFSDLQLQMRIAEVGEGGTCSGTVMDEVANENDFRVFVFDAADAQVTFSGMNGVETGLPGKTTYCVGISNYEGSGKDESGTFIRKASKGGKFNGIYPTFVSTLNRME